MNNKAMIIQELKQLIPASVALVALSLTINLLSWKYSLVSGGFPGYGLFISYLSGFSVGSILLVINTLIFLMAFFFAGRKSGIRAIYGYLFFSLIIDFERNIFHLSQTPITNEWASLAILSAQGLMAGVAVAMFLYFGYSAGGWGTFYFIIKKYVNISAQRFFLLMDIFLAILVYSRYGLLKGFFLLINALTFFLGFKLFSIIVRQK